MIFDKNAYKLGCRLKLKSGRSITLEKLIQAQTYIRLWEGVPDKKFNDHLIQRAIDRARRQGIGGKPCIIEPKRRDYLQEPGDMKHRIEQRNRPPDLKRIPEWLPQIECIGIFNSSSTTHGKDYISSTLTILWYQDNFGIDQDAIDRLREVDWNNQAIDYNP